MDSSNDDDAKAWRSLLRGVVRARRKREKLGLPPFDPLALEPSSDAVLFNILAALPGSLCPEGISSADVSAELASGVGFVSGVAACILLPATELRAELFSLVPDYERTDIAERLGPVLAYAFAHSSLEELVAACPADLPHLRAVLEGLGFRVQFVRENTIARGDSATDCVVYRLTLDDWIPTSPLLAEISKSYPADWANPADELQALYIGFLAATRFYNNAPRGVAVYNRWAALAGVGSIELPAVVPPLLLELPTDTRH